MCWGCAECGMVCRLRVILPPLQGARMLRVCRGQGLHLGAPHGCHHRCTLVFAAASATTAILRAAAQSGKKEYVATAHDSTCSTPTLLCCLLMLQAMSMVCVQNGCILVVAAAHVPTLAAQRAHATGCMSKNSCSRQRTSQSCHAILAACPTNPHRVAIGVFRKSVEPSVRHCMPLAFSSQSIYLENENRGLRL